MVAPPIPRDLAEVDAAWLSAALGVRIDAVRPGGPTGGMAVTSRVARLRLEAAESGAPRRVVVKVASPRWADGAEMYEREVRFYRDFAPGAGLPVPECYYADFDAATGQFVLVLEDVGDAVPGHRLDGLTADEADSVVDQVAALHRAWWGRAELGALKVRGHSDARIAETVATLRARWRALEDSGRYAIDDALHAAIPGVAAAYADGMRAISTRPHTLIHSDLHVENFLLDGTRLIVIDWQNACHGHCGFDVTHVLTSLQPALVAAQHDRLLARYHAALAAPDYPLAQLRDDVAAAVRHQFIGSANWFATTEAESLRDARMIQGHWTRLCATLLVSESARRGA